MTDLIKLNFGDYALELEPLAGGTVTALDWRGQMLLRRRCGQGPLNSACFPLAPYSNRIAHGRFQARDRLVELVSSFPEQGHPHALHGVAWLKPWTVREADQGRALITYTHEGDGWPWRFEVQQRFEIGECGLAHEISLLNCDDTPMPAGIGLHPYFPLTPLTRYLGRHRGEWLTDAQGLPCSLQVRASAEDWWEGAPLSARVVDTVYVGREGDLSIWWPERELSLRIAPSQELSFTVVYAPAGANFFCVEPVSHETDAVNRPDEATGLRWLEPGQAMMGRVLYTASQGAP